MVEEEDHSHEEVERQDNLEQALRGLRPLATRIDRDRFLFLAGRAAAEAERSTSRFGKWAWPASTFLSTASALVLLSLLLMRPAAMPTVAGSQAPSSALVTRAPEAPISVPAANAVSSESQPPSEGIAEADRTPADGWVAGLGFAAPDRSRRLHPYILASRGTSLDETVSTEYPSSKRTPVEEPRTQRELLEEFLKANAPATTAAENPAG
jgi:hypothetical protein